MKVNEIIVERTTATPLGHLKNQPGFGQGFISGLMPDAKGVFQQTAREKRYKVDPSNVGTDHAATDPTNQTTSPNTQTGQPLSPEYQQAQQRAQDMAKRAAQYKPPSLDQATSAPPTQDTKNTWNVKTADGGNAVVRSGYKDKMGRDVPTRVTYNRPDKTQTSYTYDNKTKEWRETGTNNFADAESVKNLNQIADIVATHAQQAQQQAQQQDRQQRLQRARQNRQQRRKPPQGGPTQ